MKRLKTSLIAKLPRTRLLVAQLALAPSLFIAAPSLAVTKLGIDARKLDFSSNIKELKPSIQLPVKDRIEMLAIPRETLRARAKLADKDGRVEALSIKVPAAPKEIGTYVRDIARAQQTAKLYDYLAQKVYASTAPVRKDGTKKIVLDYEALGYFNLDKLSNSFAKTHHSVKVASQDIRDNSELRKSLLSQVKYFLTNNQRKALRKKIAKNEDLLLERDLLPTFAEKYAKRYLAFKGPNCFHAALAFHGEEFSNSSFVNVKREEGYHPAMINYDELWRAITADFYEVDPDKAPLKYGDMIVFFDVPKEAPGGEVNYRWIRHAATYLIDQYTFSKGSKSPDTPYSINTLDEEWNNWKAMTKNLGLKVFRRSSRHVKKALPAELSDWMY